MQVVLGTIRSVVHAKLIYPFILALLSLMSFVSTLAIFPGFVVQCVLAVIFVAAFFMAFLYKFIADQEGVLIHFQPFYIVPLLVSITVTSQYGIAEYLLQIIAMISIALLCGIEIAKCKDALNASKRSIGVFLLAIPVVSMLGLGLVKFPVMMKFVTLAVALSLYAMLNTPAEKLLAFKAEDKYRKEKNIAFIGLIIAAYGFMLFTGEANFWFYFVYVVSVVNLGFSFRDHKSYFILFVSIVSLASLIPFAPREVYVDCVFIVFLAMLFHLKSPVLFYKQTQYGTLKVEYSYYSNKIFLVNDGIIQGEKLVSDDGYKNLRYFGNVSTNSVISSIFYSLDEEKAANIAVLGLGTGAMAMFGKAKHSINFYEINPEIVKIAYNNKFFDYISKSKSKVSVILGDARTQLSLAPVSFYSLICVDVYLGSDIPNHFLTLEAVEMYFTKLNQEGVLVFHATSSDVEEFEHRISNIAKALNLESSMAYERYVEEPDARQDRGLVLMPQESDAKTKIGQVIERLLRLRGLRSSEEEVYSWIVLTRKKENIAKLLQEKRWYNISSNADDPLYTDSLIGYGNKGNITQEVD